MANRVGGEFFDDFAGVAKTAATPQEIHEVVGNLDQILNLLETADNVGDVPETDAALRGELDGIYTRISRMKNQLLKCTYGRAAAAKLKPVVAAMLDRVTKAYGKDKDMIHGDECWGCPVCEPSQDVDPGNMYGLAPEQETMTAAIDRSQQEWPEGTAYEIPGEIPVEAALDRSEQEWPDDQVYEISTEESNQPRGVLPEAESLRQFPERPKRAAWSMKCPSCQGTAQKATPSDEYKCQNCSWSSAFTEATRDPNPEIHPGMGAMASASSPGRLGIGEKHTFVPFKNQAERPECRMCGLKYDADIHTNKPVKEATTDGEFSDIGGTSADLSKAVKKGAEGLEEGDEARGKLPSGAFVRGEIEEVLPDGYKIKGRKFKFEDVESAEETTHKQEELKQRDTAEHAEDAEREKQEKREKRIENSVTVTSPSGSPGQMVPALQRINYSLTLKYKAPQYLEQAEREWSDWSGGEQLGEECTKQYDTSYGREWTLVYRDPERNMPVFFGIEPLGTHEGKRSPTPIGLSKGDAVYVNYPEIISELVKAGLRMNCGSSTQELRASMNTKNACGDNCAECDEEVVLPTAIALPGESQGANSLPPAETAMPETEKEAGFNFFFPGQVLKEFYPGLQHEVVDYPNENNSPMIEDIDLDAALNTPILAAVPRYAAGSDYVSTSPAAAAGIGRDGKPQVLDGAPLRKENDIRGGMFMDEFHQQYTGVPGALLSLASAKIAAGDEKKQFGKFLKLVMGEIAATMVAAFKVTSRPILNQVPGIGEVQLAQVEQPSSLSSFNIVNTGSRVKKLLDKLNDSDIKEAINDARAQAAVWLDDPNGGYVYEVFARAESIDTDSMIMKYTFVTGTKESE